VTSQNDELEGVCPSPSRADDGGASSAEGGDLDPEAILESSAAARRHLVDDWLRQDATIESQRERLRSLEEYVATLEAALQPFAETRTSTQSLDA